MPKKNKSELSNISQCIIVSNKSGGDDSGLADNSFDITPFIMSFSYMENIMTNSIEAEIIYAEPRANPKANRFNGGKPGTLSEILPIVGTELVTFKVQDDWGNKLGGPEGIKMYVRTPEPSYDDTQKSMSVLHLTSKESIINKSIVISETIEGDISGWVEKILTDTKYLGSEKNVETEPTSEGKDFPSYVCTNKTPFTAIDKLSPLTISDKGKSGYILFETSKGFNFKSIDWLFDKEENQPKVNIFFSNSVTRDEYPPRYDTKALTYNKISNVDAISKQRMGTYNNRTILFDPFTCFYEVKYKNNDEIDKNMGGNESPVFNPEFGDREFTRTLYYLVNRGTLPKGPTNQQLESSKERDIHLIDTRTESMMRYNQIFSSRCSVIIKGNYSLNVGDSVFLDVPGSVGKTEEVNRQDSGLYIISDLTHTISLEGTTTQLNLTRDSVGRKGQPEGEVY